MKFLCEQCKAKYQISDDRVAGKTIRMKCRKCGYLIEVRSEITEQSVSNRLPTAAGASAPQRGAPRPPAKPPAPLATRISTAKPAPARPAPSALAGALKSSVSKESEPPSGLQALDATVSAEWYVAINGVPVGPVRYGEIRRKAAQGSVTEDSLVWKEGLEEWRPVRTVTELAELVREAAASGRTSFTPPPPGVARVSAPPPAPRRAGPARPQAPTPLAQPKTIDVLSSSEIEIAEPVTAQLGSGLASVAPDPFASDPFASMPPPATAGQTAPLGSAASLPPARPSIAPLSAVEPAGVPPRRQRNLFPIFLGVGVVLAFVAFGGVAGYTWIQGKIDNGASAATAATTATTTTAPTDTAPKATATGESVAELDPPEDDDPSSPAAKPRSGGAKKPVAAAAGAGTKKPATVDVSALLAGSGGGPSTGGGSGGAAHGGSSLDQTDIERVVRQRKTGVKRKCWDRAASKASSANVRVKITIANSGHVSSAAATGDDPVVTKCIESSVRGWVFPRSGGTTQAELPFHFVRQ